MFNSALDQTIVATVSSLEVRKLTKPVQCF